MGQIVESKRRARILTWGWRSSIDMWLSVCVCSIVHNADHLCSTGRYQGPICPLSCRYLGGAPRSLLKLNSHPVPGSTCSPAGERGSSINTLHGLHFANGRGAANCRPGLISHALRYVKMQTLKAKITSQEAYMNTMSGSIGLVASAS